MVAKGFVRLSAGSALTVLLQQTCDHIQSGPCAVPALQTQPQHTIYISWSISRQESRKIKTFAWAHRTRSIPSRASSGSTACLVQTASFPIHTPCSLAPISAPQSQAGLLSTTAWVCSAWGMEMYVHYMEKRIPCKSSTDWPFAQQPHIWRKYETYILNKK